MWGYAMRLKHIDRIRAIAVLFMVEVHTAAIVPPSGITVGHPAAFVAAAFGGMAAPMFVTISGWGMYSSSSRRLSEGHSTSQWAKWIAPRFAVLCVCASPLILGSNAGTELGWFERVDARGPEEWLARLLWNGTYPVFPWAFYILLGTVLHDLRGDAKARERGVVLGVLATSITLVLSVVEGIDWALTSGDAILTFFPASMPFLVVSGTMVALSLWVLEGDEISGGEPLMGGRMSFLEPAGRLSLTIYVSHFAVLGVVAAIMDGEPRLALIPAFIVTIMHTVVWIPLAALHEKKMPGISIEGLLRRGQSGR